MYARLHNHGEYVWSSDLCYIVAGNAWSLVIHIYAVRVYQTGVYEPL